MAFEIPLELETATYTVTLKDENDVVVPAASITALTLTFKDKKTSNSQTVRVGPDSSDYIDVGSDSSLEIIGDITIEARVNMQDPLFPDPLINYGIFQNETLDASGYVLRVDSNGGKLTYRTNQAGVSQVSRSSTGLTRNKWHHVAVTRTGNTATFYIDGVAVSKDLTGIHVDPLVATVSSKIGLLLDGFVDFVRIYNRVLTATEILDRFENNTDIQIGLISDWKFEGDHRDSKGSNHGTPSGTDTKKNFGIINNRYEQDVNAGVNNHTIHATSGLLTWSMQTADNPVIDQSTPPGDLEEHTAEYKWTTSSGTGKHTVSIYVRKPLI